LYMQGEKMTSRGRNYSRWRHPVFGKWLPGQPDQPSRPYFYQVVEPLGRAAGEALRVSLEDITRQLNG
jgi:hypothetical protein